VHARGRGRLNKWKSNQKGGKENFKAKSFWGLKLQPQLGETSSIFNTRGSARGGTKGRAMGGGSPGAREGKAKGNVKITFLGFRTVISNPRKTVSNLVLQLTTEKRGSKGKKKSTEVKPLGKREGQKSITSDSTRGSSKKKVCFFYLLSELGGVDALPKKEGTGGGRSKERGLFVGWSLQSVFVCRVPSLSGRVSGYHRKKKSFWEMTRVSRYGRYPSALFWNTGRRVHWL